MRETCFVEAEALEPEAPPATEPAEPAEPGPRSLALRRPFLHNAVRDDSCDVAQGRGEGPGPQGDRRETAQGDVTETCSCRCQLTVKVGRGSKGLDSMESRVAVAGQGPLNDPVDDATGSGSLFLVPCSS